MLNPLRGFKFTGLFAGDFIGDYSYSSPKDLCLFKTQNGFNLNNRGFRRELS
jgi:hypothetical protein